MSSSSHTILREEIVTLLNDGAEEFQRGQAQAAVLLLIEAQFVLGEVIQHELNKLQETPPLIPVGDERTEEETNAGIMGVLLDSPGQVAAALRSKRTHSSRLQ
jgi:hypothetical protein